MQNFKLIAHALVKLNDRYLLIKRTKMKRGKENSLPEYWDIPGGMVEEGEIPSAAAIRETKEEVNKNVKQISMFIYGGTGLLWIVFLFTGYKFIRFISKKN